MATIKYHLILLAWVLSSLCAGCHTIKPTLQDEYVRPNLNQDWHSVFGEHRKSIAKGMTKDKIPGLSIALVDREGLIWSAGFGYTDYDLKMPVTPDTIFSIQSMSKRFTITVVMLAVQEGLVDLDTPITEYLPDFTVKSRFEKKPQDRMTLRHLLNHTAGFVHEAPVGNNYKSECPSFEAHIHSISDTWLKFPVGANSSYSNLGYDLAAYIIQIRSGRSFAEYMKEKLFDPLDMSNSSLDVEFIRQHPNRAIGNNPYIERATLEIPMLGGAGVYTSARDMAKFVQFYLNWGKVKGHSVINKKFIQSIAPRLGLSQGFLDTYSPSSSDPNAIIRAYTQNTSGQGYGFRSTSTWFPEYGMGLLILTNYDNFDYHERLQGLLINLAIDLLDKKLFKRTDIIYPTLEDYLADNPKRPKYKKPDSNTFTPYKPEWKKYTGTYQKIYDLNFYTYVRIALALGYPEQRLKAKVYEKNGYLKINGKRLDEYKPGIFFTADGDCLDFSGPLPLWKGARIKKK